MTRRIALILLFILFCTPVFALDLITHDKSEYQIVLRPVASDPEKTAAQELHDFLNRITGFIQIPIVTQDQADPKMHAILIGQSDRVKQLCPDVKWTELGHDGIVIRTVGDDLILAGGEPRGSLYAVYTFLEETLGVRWWTSTEAFVPHERRIKIGDLNTVYVPKLKYREAFYHDVIGANYMQAARLKLNGHMTDIPAAWGGHYKILGWCHTFYELLPPDKYFAAHPEWYSLINGKRTAGAAQLCLTNDAMREELVKNALAIIKKDPDAGIISIAQNDCFNPCQCVNCQAIVKEEGSESGPVIHFVNQVAAEIKKQYPDFLVETLAYQYTRHPPKNIHPADNVLVRLCSIECDFAHPLSGPTNKGFAEDMTGWSAIAPNMFVWNYVTDFASSFQPHPNMNSLDVDLRWFVDNHVVGVFEQGDAYNVGAGDFLALRAWLMAHLMWNPDLDQTKLRNEFLEGYYGAAGKYLGQYLDLLNNAATDKGFGLSTYNADMSFFTNDMLAQSEALFKQAADAVADDPPRAFRVRREHLPLEMMEINRFDFAGKTKAARAAGQDPMQVVCAEYSKMLDHYQTVAARLRAKTERGSSVRRRCEQPARPMRRRDSAGASQGRCGAAGWAIRCSTESLSSVSSRRMGRHRG